MSSHLFSLSRDDLCLCVPLVLVLAFLMPIVKAEQQGEDEQATRSVHMKLGRFANLVFVHGCRADCQSWGWTWASMHPEMFAPAPTVKLEVPILLNTWMCLLPLDRQLVLLCRRVALCTV